jgi:hypothetical protein
MHIKGYITRIEDIPACSRILVSTSRKRILPRLIHDTQDDLGIDGYKWNHSALTLRPYGMLIVAESDKHGPTLTDFINTYIKKDIYKGLLLMVPKFPTDEKEYARFILPLCGRSKYYIWGLIAQFVRMKTFKWSGGRWSLWLGRNKDKLKSMMCEQFVYTIYKRFNPKLFPEKAAKQAPIDAYNNAELFDCYIILKEEIKRNLNA